MAISARNFSNSASSSSSSAFCFALAAGRLSVEVPFLEVEKGQETYVLRSLAQVAD
jgi:hypothetical protein